MINTLIVSNNIDYLKKLINMIISKFNEIYISYIATSKEEICHILSNNHIELIIFDLKFSKQETIDIIQKINSINKIEKSNIIVALKNKTITKVINKPYYETKTSETQEKSIYTALKEIIKLNQNKNYSIKRNIISELVNIGYNMKHIGTHYIFEAIYIIYETDDWDMLDNLEKNVYSIIAKEHNKSLNNIKTNIIKATHLRKKENDMQDICTPKMIISNILSQIM